MDVAGLECADAEGGALVTVRAYPRSRREGLDGVRDHALRVRVAAAADKGKANQAVCTLLARAVGLPRSAVTVKTGAARPRKRVRVHGMRAEQVRARLAAYETP